MPRSTKCELPINNGFQDTAKPRYFPPTAHLYAMGENNTRTVFKGCWVKIEHTGRDDFTFT